MDWSLTDSLRESVRFFAWSGHWVFLVLCFRLIARVALSACRLRLGHHTQILRNAFGMEFQAHFHDIEEGLGGGSTASTVARWSATASRRRNGTSSERRPLTSAASWTRPGAPARAAAPSARLV